MSDGDFSQVLSKFRWTQHHLAVLDLAVSDYVNSNPYMAAVEDQPNAEAYKVVARLRYPPPASISHIISDCVSSLQGTLDYLAWQLALREGEIPDEQTSFPIKMPNQDGSKPPVNLYGSKGSGKQRPALIHDEAVLQILRDVQPFNSAEEDLSLHYLISLRKLNNESKHRHPSVLVSTIDQGHYVYATNTPFGAVLPEGINLAMVTTNFCPLHDGDEMAWVHYLSAPDGAPPEYDDFPTVVSLEMAPRKPSGHALTAVEALTGIAMRIDQRILYPVSQLMW